MASADVYGQVPPSELPIGEDRPLRPVSPYGASKAAADFIALQAHLGRGPRRASGPARSTTSAPARATASWPRPLASRIARNELDGGDEVPVGNLTPRRDFTDVRDVVRAYRLLVERGEPGEAYNVCSGRDVAVQEIADRLVAMADRPDAPGPRPRPAPPGRHPRAAGRPSRLHDATGWAPEITLDQTLADVLDDWRKRVRES